ncbi:L,D-transpeptidase [Corynebacterium sp.]|uniref:L,D-transpeptidase n=1 Tax=Corynebacterium sp. TaxID=1720 RepID=UPI0026DCA878|nr:L,D-transpeptidase [Corynebacterium sp.]MDO4610708.1 L,D-transpeptidase [Corynebacterium sp.]
MTGKHRKPSRARRIVSGAIPLAATTTLGGFGVAGAAPLLPGTIDTGSQQITVPNADQVNEGLDRIAGSSGVEVPQQARDVIGQVFPDAPAPAPEPAPAPAPDLMPDPAKCATAKSCVDLAANKAWLLDGNGNVVYGPVPITAGAPDPSTATPTGTHHVTRKVKDEVSHEFNNAPMPYSVYFTNNGHAFHEGSLQHMSHGCIHLSHEAAVKFFEHLQVGDEVVIY